MENNEESQDLFWRVTRENMYCIQDYEVEENVMAYILEICTTPTAQSIFGKRHFHYICSFKLN